MMANLEEMSRVLYSHDWARVQDWVTALDQLGTITDDEIAVLVHQAVRPPAGSVRRRTAASEGAAVVRPALPTCPRSR
jgi:hypothetical protein